MGTQVNIKIGGEAGQGIQTIGALLSEVCLRSGLFIFAVNHFESRIRGGRSFNVLRISDEPLTAPAHEEDILVAINRHIYERERKRLPDKAIVSLNRVQMSGSQAAALGVLASNCRFFSFYPMSPATDILSHAAAYGTDLPAVVEQAEGEIAAVNMAIGASFDWYKERVQVLTEENHDATDFTKALELAQWDEEQDGIPIGILYESGTQPFHERRETLKRYNLMKRSIRKNSEGRCRGSDESGRLDPNKEDRPGVAKRSS